MRANHACRVCVLLCFMCFFAVPEVWAQAEGVVRGQVLAAADGSAVAQASMTLSSVSGDTVRSSTDAAG